MKDHAIAAMEGCLGSEHIATKRHVDTHVVDEEDTDMETPLDDLTLQTYHHLVHHSPLVVP